MAGATISPTLLTTTNVMIQNLAKNAGMFASAMSISLQALAVRLVLSKKRFAYRTNP